MVQPLWKTVWRLFRNLNIELPLDPAVPHLGIYPEKTTTRKDTCTPMFIVALFFFFVISWAAPAAYGGSQARGLIGAVATGLHHSHSNARSSHVCDLRHSSWQHRIPNPLIEACNLMVSSWTCFCCATMGTSGNHS